MTRYREINPVEMTPAQKEVHDEIVAGKRGRFGGTFQLLIRAPEVCRHLSRLGEYLRWGSSLPPALSELAICLTARSIRANYEWYAHAPLAVEAGVPANAIEAIRTGAKPELASSEQALVYRVVTELIETKRLSDTIFAWSSNSQANSLIWSEVPVSPTVAASLSISLCRGLSSRMRLAAASS